jgi:5'-3' exonuclease
MLIEENNNLAKEKDPEQQPASGGQQFELFSFKELRQFLCLQFKYLQLGFGFNLERVIDDFTLLTLLMGSPVLPPLPFMSYGDLGFDCILYIYKRILPYLEGYITDGGDIDFARLSMLFKDIGFAEEIMVKNISRL